MRVDVDMYSGLCRLVLPHPHPPTTRPTERRIKVLTHTHVKTRIYKGFKNIKKREKKRSDFHPKRLKIILSL